jgi:hypothetical protein
MSHVVQLRCGVCFCHTLRIIEHDRDCRSESGGRGGVLGFGFVLIVCFCLTGLLLESVFVCDTHYFTSVPAVVRGTAHEGRTECRRAMK